MKKAIAVFVICCVVAAFADNPHITMLRELVDVAFSSPANGDVLTFNSSTGKWENRSNAQPVFPDTSRVVLRYQQEGLSDNFQETAFFTSDEEALYRLNVFVVTTPRLSESDPCQASGAGGGSVQVSYRGDLFNILPPAIFNGNGTQAEASGLIKAKTGFPFTVSARAGTCPYSFYIVVEKL